MKITKKTWIIIAAVAVVVIIAAILIFRRKPEDETESNAPTSSGSSWSNITAALTLPEGGYPIYMGVSKRREVQYLQNVLKTKYGADLGSWGVDGQWGQKTEDAVMLHLKKNRFNTYGELQAAIGANAPSGTQGSTGLSGVMDIVNNLFGI